MKVAIQGIQGSFHHIVAENFYSKDIELLECMTFSEMPMHLQEGRVDALVMAIENSIAGAILPNYALIDKYDLKIVGEYYLSIHQNLMALPGQTIDDIKEVCSHPMALLQCGEFFEKHTHIKLIEDKDTAEVAKRINDNQLKGVGAIASTRAADIYNLEVLAPEIQTIKQNQTRFFILEKRDTTKNLEANKASLKFTASHQAGSLGRILEVFGNNNVSLTKIQSMPVIDTPWKYSFFADVTFENYAEYAKSLEGINYLVETIKVLGEYTRSNK